MTPEQFVGYALILAAIFYYVLKHRHNLLYWVAATISVTLTLVGIAIGYLLNSLVIGFEGGRKLSDMHMKDLRSKLR